MKACLVKNLFSFIEETQFIKHQSMSEDTNYKNYNDNNNNSNNNNSNNDNNNKYILLEVRLIRSLTYEESDFFFPTYVFEKSKLPCFRKNLLQISVLQFE